jgi:FkbM family methyltransferase
MVFDIGANVGFYTLLAPVLVGHTGGVVASEPVPRNLQ